MSELRSLLEAEIEKVDLRPYSIDDFRERLDHKARARQGRVAVLGILVGALVVASLIFALEARRHSVTPVKGPITRSNASKLGLVWSGMTGVRSDGAPMVSAGGRIYVTSNGKLSVFPTTCTSAAETCSPLWTYKLEAPPDGFLQPGAIVGGATVSDKRVYVAEEGAVLGFPTSCASDCAPDWRAETPHGTGISAAPVVSGGVVYVAVAEGQRGGCSIPQCESGRIYAFPETCRTFICAPLWFTVLSRSLGWRSGHFLGGTPVVAKGRIYSVEADAALEAFRLECTGPSDDHCESAAILPPGKSSLQVGSIALSLRMDGGVVYAASGSRIYALEAGCRVKPKVLCNPLWSGRTNAAITDFEVGDGKLVATSQDWLPTGSPRPETLSVFAEGCATDGRVCRPIWQQGGLSGGNVAVANGLIFTTGSTVGIYTDGCGTGGAVCQAIWSKELPSSVTSAPLVLDGYVYFADDTGGLWAFSVGGNKPIPVRGVPKASLVHPSKWTYLFYLVLLIGACLVLIGRSRRRAERVAVTRGAISPERNA